MSEKRDLSFDILRALCTLWIVGVWHLLSQSKLLFLENWEYGSPVTDTCLTCFIFISGYFLGKYRFETGKDIGVFLKKRFARFYILFFISAASLYCAGPLLGIHWFSSLKQFILCVLGLSAFYSPPPRTLWFISLLMYLYVSTPFVMYKRSGTSLPVIIIRILLMVLMPLVVVRLLGVRVDLRLFSFALFYFTAMLLPRSKVEKWKSRRLLMIPSLILWIAAVKLCGAFRPQEMLQAFGKAASTLVYEMSGVLFLLIASDFLAKVSPRVLKKAFSLTAYCSMAMYLFHRQVYAAVLAVLGKLSVDVNCLLCYLVLLPLAIVTGFFIQKLYDRALGRVEGAVRSECK